MPLYTYTCQKCGKQMEILIRGGDAPKCPHCGAVKLKREAGVFAAMTSESSASSSHASGPCCGCSSGGSCPLGGE